MEKDLEHLNDNKLIMYALSELASKAGLETIASELKRRAFPEEKEIERGVLEL